jgi:formylglycine-generating enzyme required for sulfatase activity
MHPANGLTWAAAERVCAWLGGRLPTEVEWEVAARGPDALRFPWGAEVHCGLRLAVVDRDGRTTMAPPCANEGTRNPNELSVGVTGFVAQAGNVWEWTADAWTPPDGGPKRRIQRGGGWMERDPADLRTTVRVAADPEARLVDVGVRCAWPADQGVQIR